MLTAWESYFDFASVWKAVNTRRERLEWYGKVGTFKHSLFSHQKHQHFTNELESTFSWQQWQCCHFSLSGFGHFYFWDGSFIFSCGSVHISWGSAPLYLWSYLKHTKRLCECFLIAEKTLINFSHFPQMIVSFTTYWPLSSCCHHPCPWTSASK